VACWRTKAAISLKRVKIEKSYYGRPIETHQSSFKALTTYHGNTALRYALRGKTSDWLLLVTCYLWLTGLEAQQL